MYIILNTQKYKHSLKYWHKCFQKLILNDNKNICSNEINIFYVNEMKVKNKFINNILINSFDKRAN